MDKIRAHVVISGMVQGVFFRSHAVHQATSLGLTGWVKNLDDGSVEAVFEGDKSQVEKMIKWCHKGPSMAIVEKADIKYEDYRGEFRSFNVSY